MDPMARFALSGETLDPDLRQEVLALGTAAIPELLRYLNDDTLQQEDSPGGGWPPIHAVGLLADLKATEAVADAAAAVRVRLGRHHSQPRHRADARARPRRCRAPLTVLNKGATADVHHALCCVLAKVGVRDSRIYAHLCTLFDTEETFGAICLSDYGDPAALPILEGALEDFEPDFDSPYGLSGLGDLVESFELLGGVMTPELREHVAALRAEFDAYRASLVSPARREATPERNDPCPCGSGKKYKRCCMP